MGAGKALEIAVLCRAVKLDADRVIVVSTSTQDLVASLQKDISDVCGQDRSVGCWYGRRKRMGQVVVTCTPSIGKLAAALAERGLRTDLWIADEAHRSEAATVRAAYGVLSPRHVLGFTATPFRADHSETLSLFETALYRYGVAEALADGVIVPWRIVHSETGGALNKTCGDMIADASGPGIANATDIADAKFFAGYLCRRGIPAAAVHSKQSARGNAMALEKLGRGKLRCVVHVNLLSEGANYPWLRWMLLRREVESRVRFMQEVGRGVRAHPGKTECVYYDPHDLFGAFDMSVPEALGETPEKPDGEDETVTEPGPVAARIVEAEHALAMAWIESVIRTLHVAAGAVGMLGRQRRLSKKDRFEPSTRLQRAAIRARLEGIKGIAPPNWYTCLEAVAKRPDAIRHGFASDLLAVIEGVRASGEWPPVDGSGRIAVGTAEESQPPRRALALVAGDRGQLHMDFQSA
jgi:hypothetical protein